MSRAAVAALTRAEELLRARGLTGAQAYDAVLLGLRERLGEDVEGPSQLREVLADVPVDGSVDLLGLAYERFFADLFKARRGQYFTPPPLAEVLLSLVDLGPGVSVLDPTCGSGGLLVAAARRGARVQGIELDPGLACLARLNLRLAGYEAEVTQGDFFALSPASVDVVVANPPFSVSIEDPEVLSRFALGQGVRRVLSDWLFVEALAHWVRPGGQAAVVLPWSMATNPAAAPVRALVHEAFAVRKVVALPEGVFRPFGGAAGRAMLVLLERQATGPGQFASLDDLGWDPSSRYFRPTNAQPLVYLARPDSWQPLPEGAWTPPPPAQGGRPLTSLAQVVHVHVKPSRDLDGVVFTADLADGERTTGELNPQLRASHELKGPRQRLQSGDVLVSRLRPELGNVVQLVTNGEHPAVGTPEWIAVRGARHTGWLLHALRTPAWREGLPLTSGQTRPRVTLADVAATTVPWPGEDLAARVGSLSQRIRERRSRDRRRLVTLQDVVDRWSAGELDDAQLEAQLDALEASEG